MVENKKNNNKYPKSVYAKREEEILDFWDRAETFAKSIRKDAPEGEYVFYDGPPFGTGEPHYGHILSSVSKDVVPRYFTMKGYRVQRCWGWDCHGLPIENIIEKDLGISGKKDIEKFGIAKFNEACRSRVLEYADIWDTMVRRIARWVDFKNSYKTMDASYMESVWWAFKKLWEKDLVYQGRKVLLYCPRCETPISNFEVAMDNSYKDITEASVYVKFKIKYPEGNTGRGVGALITNDKGEILLIKRNEPERRITWALPGGKTEEGESFDEAIKREVKEELGVEIKSAKAFSAQPFIFEGRLFETVNYQVKVKGEPRNLVPGEMEEFAWFAPDKLPEIDYPPSRDAIEVYLRMKKGIYFNIDNQRPLVNVCILVWTTTPWTLPGNVALAIGEDIIYALVKIQNEFLVLAKDCLDSLEHEYELVSELSGKELIGLHYEPLFDAPAVLNSGKDIYYVVEADFVTTEDGTGVVHTAVVYGEDDYNLGQKLDLPVIPAIDEKGFFNETVPQFKGMYFKKADNEIIEDLSKRKLLFRSEDYEHAYPFCWRCETQLFYNAIPAWFLSVAKIKEDLFKQNEKINWYPKHLKDGRFKLGIEQAPDWNISRNRYFATPIPIWECDQCGEREVVGTIEELEKKSSKLGIVDIHSHFIDDIIWKCKCGGNMKRIKEVFDCWVESGSMSFAQHHYIGKEINGFDPIKKKKFPAQYISEYISQTRAWFYVMHVMSTALFDSNSFENVVTTGVILNEKGDKMSKSKKNFPDPWKVVNEFGSDALRFYLMSSSLMHGDDNLYFNERDLRDVMRKNIILLGNVNRFYKMFAEEIAAPNKEPKAEYVLDRWILFRLNQLIGEVTENMDNYDLPRATRPITAFIDNLSTWYVRRSRNRFKSDDVADKELAIQTLGFVLLQLSKVCAPFMPFMAESIWQGVTGYDFKDKEKSVHLEVWPSEGKVDEKIISEMEMVRKIVEMGLKKRDEAGIKVRQPLGRFTIYPSNSAGRDLRFTNEEFADLIKDELNVKDIIFKKGSGEIKVELDIKLTDELKQEGMKRELVRAINNIRKKNGLTIQDKVAIKWQGSKIVQTVIEKYLSELKKDTIADSIEETKDLEGAEANINNENVAFKITKI